MGTRGPDARGLRRQAGGLFAESGVADPGWGVFGSILANDDPSPCHRGGNGGCDLSPATRASNRQELLLTDSEKVDG